MQSLCSRECCSIIQAAEGSRSRALGNETEHKAKATAEDTARVMIHLPKHLAQLAAAAPKMANSALIFRLLNYTQQNKEKETSRSCVFRRRQVYEIHLPQVLNSSQIPLQSMDFKQVIHSFSFPSHIRLQRVDFQF